LIFDGLETAAIAPLHLDKHGLNLSSSFAQEIAPAAALALDPEQIESPAHGKINPIMGATDPAALEPPADSTPNGVCTNGTPDTSPVSSSEPCEPVDIELDRLSIFKFTATDVFQHSPMGDLLNSLKNLSLTGDSLPNYV
jgi:hypothetical protein